MSILPEDAIDITFDFLRVGVYFLIKKGRIVYIGESEDVTRRVLQHRMQREIPFTRVAFISEPNRERRFALEAKLIGIYQPPHNSSHNDGERFTSEEAKVALRNIGL